MSRPRNTIFKAVSEPCSWAHALPQAACSPPAQSLLPEPWQELRHTYLFLPLTAVSHSEINMQTRKGLRLPMCERSERSQTRGKESTYDRYQLLQLQSHQLPGLDAVQPSLYPRSVLKGSLAGVLGWIGVFASHSAGPL